MQLEKRTILKSHNQIKNRSEFQDPGLDNVSIGDPITIINHINKSVENNSQESFEENEESLIQNNLTEMIG